MTWKYKESINRVCLKCFKEFITVYPTKKYCSYRCQESFRNITLRKKYLKMIHDYFGNKCMTCGFSDARALQIDHVDGGGVKELKIAGGIQHYRNVLNSIDSGKFQLLCANCNWIKRHTNDEK